ncbi:MAG: amidophosphoribosyltransferase [Candidatus Latescibacteria bacterium]|nr:amidophosphoribosyltransferase [bacterium]MBD3424654.1 amidophosphoribosyltransferase [Candidatus Latescibacterota bacterium]
MSGLFGVVSEDNCSKYLLYGTDYHSHLGTAFGGVALIGDELKRQIHNINSDQFKSKFREDIFNLKGNMGIGVISASEEQPIYINSKFGPFCLIMDGFINNAEDITSWLFDRGITFSELGHSNVNHAELVAKLITQGDSIVEGIEGMFDMIDGSCSLLLLHRDGIYAARDRLGYSSLALGSRDGEWSVSSESTAFLNLEFKPEAVLNPGEIVLLSREGLKAKREGERTRNQICAFLWIYTGFPTSDYEDINVEAVRERCGRCLARRDRDMEADVVSGVPDSGVGHAVGYAMESGAPYRRPLVKYTPGYGRSYTPTSQDERDLIARMKLVANEAIISGNRIVVCEDSIVRGTQLKNYTVKKLWEAGAKEIHVRPACPPLMFPCIFNLSTRSIHELAARRAIREIEGRDIEDVSEYIDHATGKYSRMVEIIREEIQVTSLKYQTIDDMVEAIGMPREKLCLYCWTGQVP